MAPSSTLFDLAQLIDAGISPREAVDRLQRGANDDARELKALRAALAAGRSLPEALRALKIATALEAAILGAAQTAGKLSEALRLVAKNDEIRRERARRLRFRLWFPNALLFVAILVKAVRAVTRGDSVSGVVGETTLIVLLVVALAHLLHAGLMRDATRWLALAWRLGLVDASVWVREHFEQTFYTLLAWHTEAGLDFETGAKSLRALIKAPRYGAAVARYERGVAQGRSVFEALTGAGLLQAGELGGVVRTAEQAGRLPAALHHYLDLKEREIDARYERLLTWLPRGYYLLVLGIGSAVIL